MKQYARQLRRTIIGIFLLFATSVLAITGYTLWRLRADAVASGLDLAAMHAQRGEDLLTQSLLVSELIAASVVTHDAASDDARQLGNDFVALLRRAPFVRSVSLLDADGAVIASSNPANMNRVVATADYLPTNADGAVLRIGRPWIGRDFATGWPSAAQPLAASDSASFIPVTQALTLGGRRLALLIALNPDYFVNYLAQKLDPRLGRVDVLRYDGLRLLNSDGGVLPGTQRDVSRLALGEVESGQFTALGAGRDMLTAFRASRLYPLVVIAEIDRDHALQHWRAEARTLFGVVGAVLLVMALASVVYYRRQLQLIEQRAEFRRLQRINASVFAASPVAILVVDDHCRVVSLNAAYESASGYRAGELIGRPLSDLLTVEDAALFAEKTRPLPGGSRATPAAAEPATIPVFEVKQRCRDGTLIWMEVSSTPEHNARGAITGYQHICRNITERKQMEDRVRQLALHDALTQLPNRRLLGDRLRQAMAASSRSACYGALLFLDLDNFKPLNDAHGHGVGDLLLIEVARRLLACIRETDTAARFGGDEFVVMLARLSEQHADSAGQAMAVAEKISAALAQPYRLPSGADGTAIVEHRCSASIGVALFHAHELTPDELMRQADAAMYRAKQSGANRVCFDASRANMRPDNAGVSAQ